jgi:hypothetical protein
MTTSRIRRTVAGVLGAGFAVIAPVALAAPASAAPPAITITSANGVLTIQGTAGADDVVVRGTAASLAITANPSGSVLAVPPNCTAPPGDTNDATCPGPFTKIVVNGGDGDDSMRGGAGDDFLAGGFGPFLETDADHQDGGSGTDTVSYFGHNPGAVVTRDGEANDGTPGEKDNVDADVENVVGRVTVLS